IETNVPQTQFPYSRTEFYEDGSGEIKRVASPGNQHRLGAEHEVISRRFPVRNELNHYAELRFQNIYTKFLNSDFQHGTMIPWENFNPFGQALTRFQWAFDGTIQAGGYGTGEANTMLLGQRRPSGGKWPKGEYTVKIQAS